MSNVSSQLQLLKNEFMASLAASVVYIHLLDCLVFFSGKKVFSSTSHPHFSRRHQEFKGLQANFGCPPLSGKLGTMSSFQWASTDTTTKSETTTNDALASVNNYRHFKLNNLAKLESDWLELLTC